MHDKSMKPDNKYRDIFPAKLLLDQSMAHRIDKIIDSANKADNIMVICGVGHMAYGFGIPELIWRKGKVIRDQTYLIYTQKSNRILQLATYDPVYGKIGLV